MANTEIDRKINGLGIRPMQTPEGRLIGEVTLEGSQLRNPANDEIVSQIQVEWRQTMLRMVYPPGLRFIPPIRIDTLTDNASLTHALNHVHELFQQNLKAFRLKLASLGLRVQISGSGENIAPVELFERGTALLRIEADGIWIRRFIPDHRTPFAMAHKLNLDSIEDAADLGIAIDSAIRQVDAVIEESIPMRRAPNENVSLTLGDLAAVFDPRAKITALKIQSIYPQKDRVLGLTVEIDNKKGIQGSVYEHGRLLKSAKYEKVNNFGDWIKELLPDPATPLETSRPTSIDENNIAPGTEWHFLVQPKDPEAENVQYTFTELSGRPCGASLSLPQETFSSLFNQRPEGFTGYVRVTGERGDDILYVHLTDEGRMMTNPISIDRGTFVLCFKKAE